VCVQIECIIKKKENTKIKARVRMTFKCRAKTTFAKKKYESRVTMNETVRADDKRAIVLMEETIKMFSERRRE
jgi:hypothetical protein